ncbi:hypothetical protein CPC197_1245, partial [Chlamydia psittaci C1/97]
KECVLSLAAPVKLASLAVSWDSLFKVRVCWRSCSYFYFWLLCTQLLNRAKLTPALCIIYFAMGQYKGI